MLFMSLDLNIKSEFLRPLSSMLKAVSIGIPIIHLGYKSFASVCRQKVDLGFLFLLKGRVRRYKKDVPSSGTHETDNIAK